MLEQILDYIHNYFVKEVHNGTYTIASGTLSVDFLLSGQYFRVVGSVLNDGVYKYPATNMTDETFTGYIWAMAVPPSVIALASEIEEWESKYGSVASSPYQSESFGGYSYTKASVSNSNGSNAASDWRSVFGKRLNYWRKIS